MLFYGEFAYNFLIWVWNYLTSNLYSVLHHLQWINKQMAYFSEQRKMWWVQESWSNWMIKPSVMLKQQNVKYTNNSHVSTLQKPSLSWHYQPSCITWAVFPRVTSNNRTQVGVKEEKALSPWRLVFYTPSYNKVFNYWDYFLW